MTDAQLIHDPLFHFSPHAASLFPSNWNAIERLPRATTPAPLSSAPLSGLLPNVQYMVMAVDPGINGIQLSAASSVHTPAYSSFEPIALTHRPASTAVCESYDDATDILTVATLDQEGARVDIQVGDIVTIGAASSSAMPGGVLANAKYLEIGRAHV